MSFVQKDEEIKYSDCKALIICRDLDGLESMQSEAANFLGGAVVVASDDPRVQQSALEIEGVEQAIFLEKMESHYCVADDVVAVIRQVNQFLEGLGHEDDIPADLLYWVMHCEGGDTSQRVLDVLLLLRSYRELIDRFQPDEIVLIQSVDATWEDKLLLALADDLGIEIRVSGKLGLFGWLNKRIWLKWRPMAVGIYWLLNIIRVKLSNLFHSQPNIDDKKSVMLQLATSEIKHLNYNLRLVKALNSSGLQGVVLGWRLGQAAAMLRRDGVAVVELESWISLRDIFCGWIKTLKSWKRLRQKRQSFLTSHNGDIKAIRGILMDSLFFFYMRDVVHRYYLSNACRNFFSLHVPRALCPWIRMVEGITAHQSLPAGNETLLFQYGGWPYNIPNPVSEAYFDKATPNEQLILFTISERHSEIMKRQGFLPNNLYVAGFHHIPINKDLLLNSSKSDFRKSLGLELNGALYIFLDPSLNRRGDQSLQEQLLVLETLLDIAKNYPEVVLIIKPHPNHKPGILESIIDHFSLPNVTLIPPRDLPHAAIKASDIIISKWSTILFEAMLLDVPGVGIILDNEPSFDGYEGAVDYCYSADELRQKILDLAQDCDYRALWKEQMKKKQLSFLASHGLSTDSNYDVVIAEKLKQLISDIDAANYHKLKTSLKGAVAE